MSNFLGDIDGKVSGNKFFGKEKGTITMMIAALVIFVVDLIQVVDADWFYATVSILWGAAIAFCISFGAVMKKENFIKLGVLLESPFLINAFVNSASRFSGLTFEFSVWYGLFNLVMALGWLCAAAGFVMWALEKFLEVKIPAGIITLLAIIAAVIFFVGFIFGIINCIDISKFETYYVFNPIALIAADLLFFCEYSRER